MQSRIRKVSLLFRILFQICFIGLPLIHVLAWLQAPEPLLLFGKHSGAIIRAFPDSVKLLYQLNWQIKLAGFLVSAIPIVVGEFILYFLIKLFYLYENDEIFSLKNVNYIKKIGYTLLIIQLVRPLCEGILTGVMTWKNLHGHRVVSITFDGTDFALVIVAFLIILIGWIMAEGCRLREEQQLTI